MNASARGSFRLAAGPAGWVSGLAAAGALAVLVAGVPWALHEAIRRADERREELCSEARQVAAELSLRFVEWRSGNRSSLGRPGEFAVTEVGARVTPVPLPGPAVRALLAANPPDPEAMSAAIAAGETTPLERAMLARALRRAGDETAPLQELATDGAVPAELRLLLRFDLAERDPQLRAELLAELLAAPPGGAGPWSEVAPGRRARLCRELLAGDDPRLRSSALRALDVAEEALRSGSAARSRVYADPEGSWLAWVHAPERGPLEVVSGPAEQFFRWFSAPVAAGTFRVELAAGAAILPDPLPPWFLDLGPAALEELARTRVLQGGLRLVLAAALALVLGAVSLQSWRAQRRERTLQRRQDEFVCAVTHELKTPLATIALCAETLREHGAGDPEIIPRFSAMILDEAERLGHRIQQILDVAAGRAAPPPGEDRFDATGVVEAVVAELRPGAAARGVEIALELPAERPRLAGAAELYAQAVNGVLENAIHHGGRGRVRVLVRPGERDFEVWIADRGPGLSAEDAERAFEPFVRLAPEATRTVPGTGLGLTLVRQCLRALGGDIEVRPRPPRGAVFVLSVPLPAEDLA